MIIAEQIKEAFRKIGVDYHDFLEDYNCNEIECDKVFEGYRALWNHDSDIAIVIKDDIMVCATTHPVVEVFKAFNVLIFNGYDYTTVLNLDTYETFTQMID